MLKSMNHDVDPVETAEWVESLDDVVQRQGPERAAHLLGVLQTKAQQAGVEIPFSAITPYVNTIPVDRQPEYPGDRALERRIKSIVRWNALAMVAKGKNGGHIATYQSAATLLEVGFNHFYRGPDAEGGGDFVYFQGHASPGVYARAFLEGRLNEQKLNNFRKELAPGGGLSSYPHPWLMPDFWQFPTVSMGLGPLTAIYHARFLRYLEDRGLKDTSQSKVWCYIGDGEVDEVETLGAIHLASRENLDNLIFVVNCNLQRLDGPVRGNGKIIQELEGFFRGAGWNALKVVWGTDWDPLLAADESGALVRRMGEVVDGDYQKYVVEDGAYFLDHFCGADAELRQIFAKVPVEQVHRLRRGGHDPSKVYAAYKAAVDHIGAPTVILAKSVKGYGLGVGGEGFNSAHNVKGWKDHTAKILAPFRDRFEIPISDEKLKDIPFYHPGADSPEVQYIRERRKALGGPVPSRRPSKVALPAPASDEFSRLMEANPKEISTTFSFVQAIGVLLRSKTLGKYIVPIIPDEARTFGMEGMMSAFGIYSPHGQLYTPVDAGTAGAFRESKTGQVLEEGINEAGAMASFVAAGTAYANHGVPTIPFYIYYSMFGFQRIGDMVWLAADARCRGFLLGATAGRTTLNGEGLQHEDGHSHLIAATVPNCITYDPAFRYELILILRDGIRRMYENNEDVLYYITLYNEPYAMPAMPAGAAEGVLKGMYKFRSHGPAAPKVKARPQILGSGPIILCALKAQEILADKFGVASDVFSVTSYKELRREAVAVERWNLLHPGSPAKTSYVEQQFKNVPGPIVAVSDNIRLVPEQIAPWAPGGMTVLGTDGFGRSESRENLRRHFEIDAEFVAFAALNALCKRGELERSVLARAMTELGIDPEKIDPLTA